MFIWVIIDHYFLTKCKVAKFRQKRIFYRTVKLGNTGTLHRKKLAILIVSVAGEKSENEPVPVAALVDNWRVSWAQLPGRSLTQPSDQGGPGLYTIKIVGTPFVTTRNLT